MVGLILPAILLTPPTTATVSAATAGSATFCLRTRLIDVQRTAVEVRTVQSSDCTVAFGVVAHFNEPKAARLSCITIGHDADTINRAMRRKHGSNRILGSTEAQVPYKYIFHFFTFLSEVAEQESRQDRTRAESRTIKRCQNSTDWNYFLRMARKGSRRNPAGMSLVAEFEHASVSREIRLVTVAA